MALRPPGGLNHVPRTVFDDPILQRDGRHGVAVPHVTDEFATAALSSGAEQAAPGFLA